MDYGKYLDLDDPAWKELDQGVEQALADLLQHTGMDQYYAARFENLKVKSQIQLASNCLQAGGEFVSTIEEGLHELGSKSDRTR